MKKKHEGKEEEINEKIKERNSIVAERQNLVNILSKKYGIPYGDIPKTRTGQYNIPKMREIIKV